VVRLLLSLEQRNALALLLEAWDGWCAELVRSGALERAVNRRRRGIVIAMVRAWKLLLRIQERHSMVGATLRRRWIQQSSGMKSILMIVGLVWRCIRSLLTLIRTSESVWVSWLALTYCKRRRRILSQQGLRQRTRAACACAIAAWRHQGQRQCLMLRARLKIEKRWQRISVEPVFDRWEQLAQQSKMVRTEKHSQKSSIQ
jgi:hypothetical protein